jgi:hypothetical protein
VLRDCEAALADLRAGPTGLQWRTRWAAAVALLRSVGHVLDKVDGAASPERRKAFDEAWEALQNGKPRGVPEIFWRFIEDERNNLLKAYRTSARQNVTVSVGPVGSNRPSRAAYEHVMASGPFAGQDPRDVVEQAIAWWRAYLDAVDQRAAALGGP